MTDGEPARKGPEVRPSKFGAGYTVGSATSAQPPAMPPPAMPPPAMPPPAMPPSIVLPPSGFGTPPPDASGTVSHSAVTAEVYRAPVAILERPPVGAPDPSGRNVLATVSLVLVILFGAFISPITLIMAYFARAQSRRSEGSGAGLAVAAIIVSYVFLVIALVVVTIKLLIV